MNKPLIRIKYPDFDPDEIIPNLSCQICGSPILRLCAEESKCQICGYHYCGDHWLNHQCPPAKPIDEKLFCQYCGNRIGKGTKFCILCGSQLNGI